MNSTIRTTAAALGVGALLAGGLAVGTAVAASGDTSPGTAFGYGMARGSNAGTGAAGARGQGMGMTQRTATATTTTATATPELAQALTFTREEERMARDLYAAVADLYDGALPFSMITNSEQRHFDAVGTLLDRYGIDDPAAGSEPGTYADADLQALYDGWWADAQQSLDAAYQVGIELEQRDIADLEGMLDSDLPADVQGVLENLLQGSRNHLAAYQRAASGDLTTGMGTGARAGNGNARGMGGYAGDCPMLDDES